METKKRKVYATKQRVIDGQKRCTKCDVWKSVDLFGKSNKDRSGYVSWCKECVSVVVKANYRKNKGNLKTYKIALYEGTKVCRRCDEEKPIDHYAKAVSNKDGRTNFCRACRVKEGREYKHKKGIHKPFVPAVVDGYRVCTKCNERKSVDEFHKTHDSDQPSSWCKICKYAYVRSYQIKKGTHKGGRRRARKEKPVKPPELWQVDIIAAVRELVEKYPDKSFKDLSQAKWFQRWRKDNPLVCYPRTDRKKRRIELQQGYKKRNPEVYKATRYKDKLRRRCAQGSHTEAEWQEVLAKHDHKCACGATEDLTRDHIIPISKGGTNFIENIQPLCRSCNSRKSNKV